MSTPPAPRRRPPEPPRQSGLGRTLGLWALLIVLGLAFYVLFAPPSSEGSRGDDRPEEVASTTRPGGLLPYLPALVPAALFISFIVFVRRTQHWGRLNTEGAAFLEDRDYERAARAFEEVSRAWIPPSRRAGRTNLGICLLFAGKPEQALDVLTSIEPKGQLKERFRGLLPAYIATCHVLLGDVAAARKQLEEARRLQGDEPSELFLLPDILVLCREGNFRAVDETLFRRWREAEAAGANVMKLLRALRAFALDRLGPAAGEATLSEAQAALEPFRPGDFDALAARWPELRAFLDARGLSAPRAAA